MFLFFDFFLRTGILESGKTCQTLEDDEVDLDDGY